MLRCPNCSAEVADEYCPSCGQRRIHPDDLSVRHFLGELAEDLAELHTQFKTIRSLRSLLRPGFLTAEYMAGRRQPYLGPFKLYLLCAAFFFFASRLAGLDVMAWSADDADLAQFLSAEIAARGMQPEVFAAKFELRFQTVFTLFLAGTVIAVSLALQVLYRRKRLLFGAHLTFGLHFMALLILATVLLVVVSRVSGLPMSVAAWWAYAAVTVCLFFALRRVYAESIPSSLWKCVAVMAVTMVSNAAMGALATRVTLWLL